MFLKRYTVNVQGKSGQAFWNKSLYKREEPSMEHCGKWACCAEVDMLLDIFPSGEVYLTASSWGLFCQKAEVKTAGEDLILTVGNRKVAVRASVEDGAGR